ncbi:hypothetical protein C8R44DRAFT_744154 [Mycena epipterygia]|nr:hypothetical protein C8R44DRAFT_744154 [Mycena epipterygia]
MPALENDNWDVKLNISQIKRLLTERCATLFNEDIIVYVPEKARTRQAAKEYFWKDGEVENPRQRAPDYLFPSIQSKIKEQIREASTSDREADMSDTRYHYQGATKVSLLRSHKPKITSSNVRGHPNGATSAQLSLSSRDGNTIDAKCGEITENCAK